MTNHNIKNLIEIKDLLKGLSEEHYGRKLEIMSGSSIGQHVRHILECYQCLFESQNTMQVNYNNRKRDIKLETEIHFAIKTIDELVNSLLDVKSDCELFFVADYSIHENPNPELIESSFYRELAYNLEHSIHHQALIKVATNEMHLQKLVSSTFGYAPSTIRHLNI